MRLTFATEDGLTAEIDLAPASDASTNSAIVSASLGLDGSLVFIANGKQFTDITVASLTAGGVKDGDVVLVTPPLPPRGASSAAPARRGGRGRGGRGGLGHLMAAARGPTIDPAIYPSLTWDDLPGGVTPEQLYAILKVRPSTGTRRLSPLLLLPSSLRIVALRCHVLAACSLTTLPSRQCSLICR